MLDEIIKEIALREEYDLSKRMQQRTVVRNKT